MDSLGILGISSNFEVLCHRISLPDESLEGSTNCPLVAAFFQHEEIPTKKKCKAIYPLYTSPNSRNGAVKVSNIRIAHLLSSSVLAAFVFLVSFGQVLERFREHAKKVPSR